MSLTSRTQRTWATSKSGPDGWLGSWSYAHRWWVKASRPSVDDYIDIDVRLFIGPGAATRAERWVDSNPGSLE